MFGFIAIYSISQSFRRLRKFFNFSVLWLSSSVPTRTALFDTLSKDLKKKDLLLLA
jgi:hypothetical protein